MNRRLVFAAALLAVSAGAFAGSVLVAKHLRRAPASAGEPSPGTAAPAAEESGEEWKMPAPWTFEECELIVNALTKEAEAFRKKSENLAFERESLDVIRRDLDARRADLARMLSEVASARGEIEAMLKAARNEMAGISETESKAAKKTADVFSNMKAEDAAAIIQKMGDSDYSARILEFVSKRQSARILGALPPELAAALAKKLNFTAAKEGGLGGG